MAKPCVVVVLIFHQLIKGEMIEVTAVRIGLDPAAHSEIVVTSLKSTRMMAHYKMMACSMLQFQMEKPCAEYSDVGLCQRVRNSLRSLFWISEQKFCGH